jgi:hypothetical protein
MTSKEGKRVTTHRKRVFPTGECWCGCGEEVSERTFFKPGHDRRAESAVIKVLYGSVARFLDEQGFGPGRRNAMRELEAYRRGMTEGEDRTA